MTPRVLVVSMLLLPLVALLAPPAPAASVPPHGWMVPGYTLSFVASAASAPEVSSPKSFPLVVAVGSVTSSSITFRWVHAGAEPAVPEATFDLATRLGPGGASILWVNPSDVEAGYARFGDDYAILVFSTPLFHQFTGGGRSYTYSAQTGLLLEADDLDTGALLTLASHQAGAAPAPTGSSGAATVGVHARHPVGNPLEGQNAVVTRACAGSGGTMLGGRSGCVSAIWTAQSSYWIDQVVSFPLMGVGTIAVHYRDMDGDMFTLTCEASRPALGPEDVLCWPRPHRDWRLAGIHYAEVETRFHYCLSPFTGFSCPWRVEVTLTGGVAE